MNEYKPEKCGLCKGLGNDKDDKPCPACRGKGRILVYQPPIQCPRCGGGGRVKDRSGSLDNTGVCPVCHGCGWVLAKVP